MDHELELIAALQRLTEKITEMSGNLGRGNKTSQVPGAKTSQEKDAAKSFDALDKMHQNGIKTQKESNKANEAQLDSTKDLTKAQRAATAEQEKLEWSMKRAKDGFQTFGQSLFREKTNFADSLGSLGNTLSRSYGVVGRTFGGIATGVGFAIGAMQNFADSAKDMGNFADLSAFQVGSVRQAKILSGLGDSFIKVIEQSNGTFKALGGNSQEAVDNLSNLSRALRYGSGYLNSAMRKSLGTDLVKSVDKAARATAAMGLSQEDTANLSGSIMATTMLNAKNEDDAKQKFVKAMAESVTSARGLSDAFGISAKAVLAAMAEFRKTQAGTVAGLEGNKGADQMYAVLKQFPSLGTDPAKLANLAAAIAEGDMSKAQYAIRDNPEATALMQQLFQSAQGAVGKEGLDEKKFNMQLEAQRSAIELEYASRKGMQGYNDKQAAPAIEAMKFLRERDIATGKIAPDKKAAEDKVGKSEADNIQTMNSLTAALESLRGVMIGLTAGVLALLGPVLSIALSGGLGGMLAAKGLKDTLLSLVKMPGAIAMATVEFFKTSGGLRGMWESTKAFSKGLLDSAKAMYDSVGGIKGMWESTKAFSKGIWESTKAFGMSIWESTKAMYHSMGGIKGMWESTKAFGNTVWEATSKFGKGMWEATKAMYANAGGVTGMLKSVKDFGITLWQAGAKAVASLWTMAMTAIQTVVPALVAMARSAFSSVIGGFGKIGPWLARIVPMLATFGSVLAGIGTAIGGVLAAITAPVWGVIAGVVAVGAGVIYFWDEIVNVSKSVWQGFTNLVSWLSSGADAIWDIITAPFTALFDWLGNSWLGKKMGFGDSSNTNPVAVKKVSTDGKVATLNQVNAAKDALRYGNSNDMSDKVNTVGNGQIVGSVTPVEFANISTPPSIDSNFGKTSADTDLAKASNENNVLKEIASGLAPETIAQLIGYLSSMQSDLSAIRSNTKTDSFSAPVRLA